MSLYDINIGLQIENLLNPLYRTQTNLDFVGSIGADLQYMRDNLFSDYKTGSSYLNYSNVTAYIPGDRVIFTNKEVYENLIACTGIDPTGNVLSLINWRKLQDNYIALDDRKMYNGQIIVLVKALNQWFGITSAPYIYIVNNNSAGLGFDMYVPLSVYNSLASTNTDRDNTIIQFTNKYAIAGIVYTINTY